MHTDPAFVVHNQRPNKYDSLCPVKRYIELDVCDDRLPITFHCTETFEEPVEYRND